MSFPWHNLPWRETSEFLAGRVHAGERVLAPDQFWWVLGRVERYVPANLEVGHHYDWVVLDTDDISMFPRAFLVRVSEGMQPQYANGGFLVWSASSDGDAPEPDEARDDGFAAFRARAEQAPEAPVEPNRYAQDAALTDAPFIARLADVSDVELRAFMNALYERTGYVYPTRRDRAYREDMDAHMATFLEDGEGRVLDLASGGLAMVETGAPVVRTDLSEVGLAQARSADARSGVGYAVMDAHHACFPDATFESVMLCDAIEHVRDAASVFREVARVLTDEGRFLVTFANRNSVNVVLARRLGYPEYVTNFQHMREFTLAEIREMLDRAGFDVEDTAGVTLYPYWGVPGVDDFVRDVTDDDAEFVELMRELGRKVGAEHAYTGVVWARRRRRILADHRPAGDRGGQHR